jgi:hypothetical protein
MARRLCAASENSSSRPYIERALLEFGNENMVARYRTVPFLQPREAEQLFTALMLNYARKYVEKNIFA